MIRNYNKLGSVGFKPTLLVAGQMFGSGETTFGMNQCNFKNPYIENEFKKLPESEGESKL